MGMMFAFKVLRMEIVRASAATFEEGMMKPIFRAVRRSAIVETGIMASRTDGLMTNRRGSL